MVLIMFAAALAAIQADSTGAQFDTPPHWRRQPRADEFSGYFPAAARNSTGIVVLDCLIDTAGDAGDCRVVLETPRGIDLAWAAQRLEPRLKFVPASLGGRPVAVRTTIKIPFVGIPGSPTPTATVTPVLLISHPMWGAAPTFEEMARVYPRAAAGASGEVTLACAVTEHWTLTRCGPTLEVPAGKGFAAAALRLTERFRLAPSPAAASMNRPLRVSVPFDFVDPKSPEFADRRLVRPTWTVGFDPVEALKQFPADAAAKGVTNGLGYARCVVGTDGALTGCAPVEGQGDGPGFSRAAVSIASAMRMNPWTENGGPVDGATVNLPIRFKLPAVSGSRTPGNP
jgi:hypothetical protein